MKAKNVVTASLIKNKDEFLRYADPKARKEKWIKSTDDDRYLTVLASVSRAQP